MPDQPAPIFAERLRPGPTALVLSAGAGLALGIALLPLGSVLAVVCGAALALGIALALFRAAPVVEVVADGPGDQGDPGEEGPTLRAGGAAIALARLGDVHELDAQGMRAILGPRADARSYLVHRSWVPTGVAVVLEDERDPTPLWVLSTRRPAELAAALRSGQAAHSVQTS